MSFRGRLDGFSDILKKLKEKYPRFGRRVQESEALSRWESIVGPMIAKHTRAIRVEKEVLWIEVDHSIWKSELHHRKQQILERLNQQNQTGALPEATPKTIPEIIPEIIKDILFLDPRR